jgi:hypothetical protein
MRTNADKELLELAAKAAGYRLEWDGDPEWWKPMYYEGKTYHSFNPLEDDGDALRLAIKLGLTVSLYKHATEVWGYDACGRAIYQEHEDDSCAATRRAIVRAAAEVGEETIQEFKDGIPEDNYYKTQAEAEEKHRNYTSYEKASS